MRRCLLIAILAFGAVFTLTAQSLLPSAPGSACTYAATISMRQATLTGICILEADTTDLRRLSGAIVNEFGISAMAFTCDMTKRKPRVKLLSVMKPLDKWYIRLAVKGQLRAVINALKAGSDTCSDTRHGITWTMLPMDSQL